MPTTRSGGRTSNSNQRIEAVDDIYDVERIINHRYEFLADGNMRVPIAIKMMYLQLISIVVLLHQMERI